jgi:hypothetical protein
MAVGILGLRQEDPHISSLSPKADADRDQAYATNGPRFGLNAVTDFSLNHGRAQGSFCAIVDWLCQATSKNCATALHH